METHHKTIGIIFFAMVLVAANSSADTLTQAFQAVAQGQQELAKGHPGKANGCFLRALHLFPGWYRPMLGLAVAALQAGKPKAEAIKWVNKALHIEPERWDTQLVAGRVMEAAGRPKASMQHYLHALPLSTAHRGVIRDFACALAARIPALKKIRGVRNLECNNVHWP